MLTFLEDIFLVLVNLPAYLLAGIEEAINAFFAAIEAAVTAGAALLPSLPAIVTPPSYLQAINWFFPLGTVIGIATSLMAAYITWLAIAWIFRKVGEL